MADYRESPRFERMMEEVNEQRREHREKLAEDLEAQAQALLDSATSPFVREHLTKFAAEEVASFREGPQEASLRQPPSHRRPPTK